MLYLQEAVILQKHLVESNKKTLDESEQELSQKEARWNLEKAKLDELSEGMPLGGPLITARDGKFSRLRGTSL